MTVNTVSILEILYVLVLHKIDTSKQEAWVKSKLKFLKKKWYLNSIVLAFLKVKNCTFEQISSFFSSSEKKT